MKVLNVSNEKIFKKFELSDFDIKPDIEFFYETTTTKDITLKFKEWQKEFSIIRFVTPLGSLAFSLMPQSSVENYQVKHVDVWENLNGSWFSHNVFIDFFKPLLINSNKIKKIQGGVMIIGMNSFIVPLIFVLNKMGYKKISIYDIDDDVNEKEFYENIKTILGASVDIVKPGSLTLLPAIYSLCIVHKAKYDDEDLKEISYFNFLAPNPVVIDMDGDGNRSFLFDEVVALGGAVITDDYVWKAYNNYFISLCIRRFKK